MKVRGFQVKEQEKLDKNRILLICEKTKGEGEAKDSMQVIIIGDVETLGVAFIRETIKEMNKKKIKKKLIIGAGKVTRSAKNEMIANNIDFIPVQLVSMHILDHEWVPKHEIIPDEEVKQLLEKYKITEDLLPKILSTDPVAKIIGIRPGQFVKITRQSATAGETTIYRICIKGEE